MSDTTHSAYREHGDGHHADDGAVHAHISSVKFYVGIFATLVMLTVLTVGLSYIHLGPANLAVAIIIASIKATLVVMFFMHLKYDNRFNALIFVCSLMFIGVFFAYTINDTGRRGEVDRTQGTNVLRSSGVAAPGGEPNPLPGEEGAPGSGHGPVQHPGKHAAGIIGDHGEAPPADSAAGSHDAPAPKGEPSEQHH